MALFLLPSTWPNGSMAVRCRPRFAVQGLTEMTDAHLQNLISDRVLDSAFAWLCGARRDYPASADIWNFRRHWHTERPRLKTELAAGQFRFGLLDRITKPDGSEIELWSARDALVLKLRWPRQ